MADVPSRLAQSIRPKARSKFFTNKSHWVMRSNPVNDIYFYLFYIFWYFHLHGIIVILNYMYYAVYNLHDCDIMAPV